MALGDTILPNAQTRAVYEAQNSKLRGEYFNTTIKVFSAGADILSQLQGGMDSGKPFVLKTDLQKGAGDTVNFTVGDELGQSGRRGDDRAVNYEETPAENSFAVVVDTLRVVLGWNELNRWARANMVSIVAAYAALTGKRVGKIEQEDLLMKLRQRSNTQNTIRPGGKAEDEIRYSDTLDTATLGIAYNVLTSNGADPASIGMMKGGMPLLKYVALGSAFAMEGLWNDPTFTQALNHAAIDGPTNPYWTNDLPDWRGLVMQRWNVINHANPGPIGSSVIPEALLGDAISDTTSALVVYGGGRTQATLGDANVLYKPFEYFYSNDKLFGKSISYGTDTTVRYFLIIDPADLKWQMVSYTGSAAFSANGHHITATQHLGATASGARVTTLGQVTYDGTYNKVAFPTGSRIVQCSPYGAPLCDTYLFGSNAGAKCYGMDRNKPIDNEGDYGALKGVGTKTIYGCEMVKDTLGNYHRGFVRIQAAYNHPLGGKLPVL